MKKQVNYRGIFFAGLTFVGAGVALSMSIGAVGYSLLGLGIALMVIGLVRRNDWSQDE